MNRLQGFVCALIITAVPAVAPAAFAAEEAAPAAAPGAPLPAAPAPMALQMPDGLGKRIAKSIAHHVVDKAMEAVIPGLGPYRTAKMVVRTGWNGASDLSTGLKLAKVKVGARVEALRNGNDDELAGREYTVQTTRISQLPDSHRQSILRQTRTFVSDAKGRVTEVDRHVEVGPNGGKFGALDVKRTVKVEADGQVNVGDPSVTTRTRSSSVETVQATKMPNVNLRKGTVKINDAATSTTVKKPFVSRY